jgi:hypothetical protein
MLVCSRLCGRLVVVAEVGQGVAEVRLLRFYLVNARCIRRIKRVPTQSRNGTSPICCVCQGLRRIRRSVPRVPEAEIIDTRAKRFAIVAIRYGIGATIGSLG